MRASARPMRPTKGGRAVARDYKPHGWRRRLEMGGAYEGTAKLLRATPHKHHMVVRWPVGAKHDTLKPSCRRHEVASVAVATSTTKWWRGARAIHATRKGHQSATSPTSPWRCKCARTHARVRRGRAGGPNILMALVALGGGGQPRRPGASASSFKHRLGWQPGHCAMLWN